MVADHRPREASPMRRRAGRGHFRLRGLMRASILRKVDKFEFVHLIANEPRQSHERHSADFQTFGTAQLTDREETFQSI
jgi:hypothetical protein